MDPSDGTRKCLNCPENGLVEQGVRSVRCKACRERHTRAKASDAQWDRRQRARLARERRRGPYADKTAPDPLIRPRRRTPSWDQYGREILDTPPLTPAQTREVLAALAEVDRAVEAVRRALRRKP